MTEALCLSLQIENYLYRNHETRKYLQEQAYRLQQGIVTTTTQQVYLNNLIHLLALLCVCLFFSFLATKWPTKFGKGRWFASDAGFLPCRWLTGFVWRSRITWTLWGTRRQTPSWRTSGQRRTSSKTPGTLKLWGMTDLPELLLF